MIFLLNMFIHHRNSTYHTTKGNINAKTLKVNDQAVDIRASPMVYVNPMFSL